METNESIMRTVVAADLETPQLTTDRWVNQTATGDATITSSNGRIRWPLATLLFGMLIYGGWYAVNWLLTAERFGITHVQVEGDVRHTSQKLLQDVLSEQIKKNFFAINLDAVRASLEGLPWIEEARVRRLWPLTLVVWVRERESLAHWGASSLVSPRGVIFTPDPASIPPKLIHLQGPEGSAVYVIGRYRWLQERLTKIGLQIATLHLSERHAWHLECTNGLQLYFGTTDLEKRAERLLRYLPQLPQPEALKHVDLRYNNGFAVSWRATAVTLDTSPPTQRDDGVKNAPNNRQHP